MTYLSTLLLEVRVSTPFPTTLTTATITYSQIDSEEDLFCPTLIKTLKFCPGSRLVAVCFCKTIHRVGLELKAKEDDEAYESKQKKLIRKRRLLSEKAIEMFLLSMSMSLLVRK